MYCINCGVRLADTEKACPLCNTQVYHPTLKQGDALPLYPSDRMPKIKANSKAISGLVIILFCIPLFICLFADLHTDGALNWFGYVAGAIVVTYIALALPRWFEKPNPVIFLPCSMVAIALYVLYIDIKVGGGWFLPFALPIWGSLSAILCSVVTLLYYVHRGRLYIFGGGIIALGALVLLVELLLYPAFGVRFVGWSIYPLAVLALVGGGLIFLGINNSARAAMERKFFF